MSVVAGHDSGLARHGMDLVGDVRRCVVSVGTGLRPRRRGRPSASRRNRASLPPAAIFTVLVEPVTYPKGLIGADRIRHVGGDWPADRRPVQRRHLRRQRATTRGRSMCPGPAFRRLVPPPGGRRHPRPTIECHGPRPVCRARPRTGPPPSGHRRVVRASSSAWDVPMERLAVPSPATIYPRSRPAMPPIGQFPDWRAKA